MDRSGANLADIKSSMLYKFILGFRQIAAIRNSGHTEVSGVENCVNFVKSKCDYIHLPSDFLKKSLLTASATV